MCVAVNTNAEEHEGVDPEDVLKAAEAERSRIGRFNLAVVGGTGVGKSSLINAVFGSDHARTGVGLPVTRGINYHKNSDGTLGIWDFEGFEVGTSMRPADIVRENLAMIAAGPPGQRIAAVWYCVASSSARLQPAEIDVLAEFKAQGLPVVVVLTKVARARTGMKVSVGSGLTRDWAISDDARAMLDWFEDPRSADGTPIDLPIDAVVATAAVDQGRFGGPMHGLEQLLEVTRELSPAEWDDAIKVAQKIVPDLKREMCRRVISAAATAAGGVAFVPIPVADAVALSGIQLAMMGKICAYYGMDLKVLGSGQLITQLAVQFAGKALARSLLKLIPGAGMFVNAAVAGGLTFATGEAWMRFCEAVSTGKVKVEDIEEAWGAYAPSVPQVIDGIRKFSTMKR
ncbi:uncharacterized protein (DUF697 family) [Myceligenerans xiligouense]|uniref:Uncharacterized protein (DUF697 family) n=1 Tax=Myceligenerans xiligouense TaxID=253184 RepID=A0A3N4Z4Y9_9MICO|nr:uncharacterized protein (DUF697 family) [Myceligenerans xiligouense]